MTTFPYLVSPFPFGRWRAPRRGEWLKRHCGTKNSGSYDGRSWYRTASNQYRFLHNTEAMLFARAFSTHDTLIHMIAVRHDISGQAAEWVRERCGPTPSRVWMRDASILWFVDPHVAVECALKFR